MEMREEVFSHLLGVTGNSASMDANNKREVTCSHSNAVSHFADVCFILLSFALFFMKYVMKCLCLTLCFCVILVQNLKRSTLPFLHSLTVC